MYEYVEGTSLREALSGRRMLYSWLSRMQTALDVSFRHYARFGCLHKYMKSSSVIVADPCFRAMTGQTEIVDRSSAQ